MKSPFPGMDPFIEDCGLWSDFHTKLIGEIERTLAVTLPERYFIQTGERSYVVLAGTDGKEERPFYPDVGVEVAERQVAPRDRGVANAEAATAGDAVTMRVPVPHREFLFMVPRGRTIFVAQPDDTVNIIDLLLVTDLELKPAANGSRRRRKT
jgi:Protein of unknown function (DUF4058)